MTFLGLVGLKDPYQLGFKRAVANCRDAGAKIKMIIGDNSFIAIAIAMECEIFKLDDYLNNVVVEGVTFINFIDAERRYNLFE